MDLEKRYYDEDGNPCDIIDMVKNDPNWAANRIQEGEKAEEALRSLRIKDAVRAYEDEFFK